MRLEEKIRSEAPAGGLSGYLSPIAAWALAFGCTVGWGSFVMPGTTFLPGSGPLGTAVGILVGGLAMSVIAWNYHCMMVRQRGPGGTFAYARNAFGHDHGFLCAWFLCLTYIAIIWANATALAIIARQMLGGMFEFGFHYRLIGYDVYMGEVMLSVCAIAVVGLVCIFRKRLAGRVQVALALLFAAGILACFVFALSRHEGGMATMAPAFAPDDAGGALAQVLHIVALAPWIFVGFESISHSSSEFRFSVRKSFRIMVVALVVSVLAYVLLALIPVIAVPEGYGTWMEFIGDHGGLGGSPPIFVAASRVLGKAGCAMLAATMLGATFTNLIGNTVAASRLLYAMAEDGVLPSWFGRLNRDGAPGNAILFVAALSTVVPFFGRTAIGFIVDVATVGAAVAYGYTSAAAFKTARAGKGGKGKFSGLCGIAMAVLICLLFLLPDYPSKDLMATESYLILVLWSILGLVFFRAIFRRDRRQRFGKSTIVWIALLVLIFFTSQFWIRQVTRDATRAAFADVGRYISEVCTGPDASLPDDVRAGTVNAYMMRRMEAVDSSQMLSGLTQTGLMALAMIILLSVYSILHDRESTVTRERVKAEESSRAKSVFLSNMSHDIRTPMNAIIGYSELAKRDGVTEEQLRGYLKRIEASSHHLLALINDVLEMSRIESGKMELEPKPTNLVKTLDEVRDMFATQMSVKKIDFRVDAAGVDSPCVMCDKNRLNRVLLNLLSNACKFTPEGGRVCLTLRQLNEGGEGEDVYELRVKDSGIGMSAEFSKHVFSAFERERTATVGEIQGTGLGMSITKSIVDLMGGTITVDTELGKGTEFTVRLPLPFATDADLKADAASSSAGRGKPVDFSSKRILLVEDSEINREIATTLLSDAGMEVDVAENGQVAVEKVSQGGVGHYDAILMDVLMPVMNGYEATRAIRDMEIPGLSDVPIIALSANAFESDVKEALDAGMNAHIAKPLNIAALLDKLAELMGGRDARHAESAGKALPAIRYDAPRKPLLAALREMGCDVDATLRATFMGNETLYCRMLGKLASNTAIARMRAALDAGDAAALFGAAHELKGVYASLGLTPLHRLCGEIVEIARPGGLDGAGERLERLEALHGEMIAAAANGLNGKAT